MTDSENYTNEPFEDLTRDAILERTGFRLQLIFPKWADNSRGIISFRSELQRLGSEFGEENVIGSLVYEFSTLNLALFVRDGFKRSAS